MLLCYYLGCPGWVVVWTLLGHYYGVLGGCHGVAAVCEC